VLCYLPLAANPRADPGWDPLAAAAEAGPVDCPPALFERLRRIAHANTVRALPEIRGAVRLAMERRRDRREEAARRRRHDGRRAKAQRKKKKFRFCGVSCA